QLGGGKPQRGWQFACRGLGSVLRRLLQGNAGPGEVHPHIAPPAITERLRCVQSLEPAEGYEMLAGRFDAAQVQAKDLSNPGGLAPAPAVAALLPVIETAEQVPQHRGDDGGFEAASHQAYGLTRDRYASAVVGNGLVHREEVGEIRHPSEVRWGG